MNVNKRTWFEVDLTLSKSWRIANKIIKLVRDENVFFHFVLNNNIFEGLDLNFVKEREELEEYARLLIRNNSKETLQETLKASSRMEELKEKYERFFEVINSWEDSDEVTQEVEDVSAAVAFTLKDFDERNQAVQ
jgi:hypothetical protein